MRGGSSAFHERETIGGRGIDTHQTVGHFREPGKAVTVDLGQYRTILRMAGGMARFSGGKVSPFGGPERVASVQAIVQPVQPL